MAIFPGGMNNILNEIHSKHLVFNDKRLIYLRSSNGQDPKVGSWCEEKMHKTLVRQEPLSRVPLRAVSDYSELTKRRGLLTYMLRFTAEPVTLLATTASLALSLSRKARPYRHIVSS